MGKRITIKDVARESGVSISVVSYILNKTKGVTISDETKERVLGIAAALNYTPNQIASGLRMRKSMCIGVVSYLSIEGYSMGKVLTGINSVADENNYRIVLCNPKSGGKEFSYLNYYLGNSIDGIIFISPHEETGLIDEEAHITKMRETEVPFVIINGHTNVADVVYVNFDFFGSTHLATRYFIEQGFRHITYVTPDLNFYELIQRMNGYTAATREAGLPLDICFERNLPTRIRDFKAVVTNKSDTAYRVINEANRHNLSIPEDFALLAANTQAYSEYLNPALSTVHIPSREIGEAAAKALIDSINGRTISVDLQRKCVLQLRQSC